MCIAAMLKLISKTLAVYVHNFNRDLPEESVRKQLCWREMGNSQPYFITTISLWFFPTVGIRLPELGEPLFFHCSMTTFLQGKQNSQIKSLLILNPRKNFKGKSCSISTSIWITIVALSKPKPVQNYLIKSH